MSLLGNGFLVSPRSKEVKGYNANCQAINENPHYLEKGDGFLKSLTIVGTQPSKIYYIGLLSFTYLYVEMFHIVL